MSKVNAGNEHELRELLVEAGHRPAVPSDDLGEIRAAARESWHSMVAMERQRARFRRTRNVFALAASIVLAVALGWWLKPDGVVTTEIVASVTMMQGTVLADGEALSDASRLEAGALIDTGAEGGEPVRLAMQLTEGQSVRIDSESRVRVTSGAALELLEGALYVDTDGSASGAPVEISTPFGMVRDIGTQFEVRLAEGEVADLTVRVREGEIALERGGQSHSAQAGEELSLHGDELDRRPVAPSAQVWDWVLEVTPAMHIEGATLGSYLEWVSRETGRELRYESSDLELSSETIVVHGSISGMTPEQSLSVVLPSSGLGYQIENGSLLIARP